MVAKSAIRIMDISHEKSTAIPKQNAGNFQSYPKNPARNVTRGVWEMARLHTREAWLCWYPAGMTALDFSVSLAVTHEKHR